MSCKDHVAGAVGDTIVRIGGKVIKELEHVPVCVVGGSGLFLGDLTEGH